MAIVSAAPRQFGPSREVSYTALCASSLHRRLDQKYQASPQSDRKAKTQSELIDPMTLLIGYLTRMLIRR